MIVANPTISAVADVVSRQKILLIEVPLRAVGRHALARAPEFRQCELVIGVDDFHDRAVATLLRDMPQIQPCDLLTAQIFDGARCLAGPEVATIAK